MTYLALESGSTLIDLTSDGMYLVDYVPRYSFGEKISTETIDVRFGGASVSAIASKIRAIEMSLLLAKAYQDNRQGQPCYLIYQPANGLPTVRSRVVGGQIILGDRATHYKISNLNMDAGIIIERENYWEATAETEIPLTNGNGTNVTGGINVLNCNDGSGTPPNKRNNYVQIASTAISGNLPAPAKIVVQNNYDSPTRLGEIYVSLNVYSNPAAFTHIIEGESAQYGGSNVSSSSYSGGYYRNITWTGDAQAYIANWQIPSGTIANGGGRWFKIFAALVSTPQPGTYVQSKLTFPTGAPLTIIQEDQEILLPSSDQFVEIGTFQIPPWLIDQTLLYPLDLILYGRRVGGGALAIDFLYIMPADSFNLWKPRGYGLAYTTYLTVDYIEKQSYVEGYSPGGKSSIYMLFGNPIELIPGMTQRLYFSQRGVTGDININRKILVRLFYRARYGTF
ncbi:MAG: hypothetical protein QXU75_07235 [Candidatus Methanomethylicaceae archaeon]